MSKGAEDDAWMRQRRQEAAQTIGTILGATLTAVSLTTEAEFEVTPPVDIPDVGRVYRIEVSATRALGTTPAVPETEPGERPYLRVRVLTHPLNADGMPSKRYGQLWVSLGTLESDGLAAPLLGTAQVS